MSGDRPLTWNEQLGITMPSFTSVSLLRGRRLGRWLKIRGSFLKLTSLGEGIWTQVSFPRWVDCGWWHYLNPEFKGSSGIIAKLSWDQLEMSQVGRLEWWNLLEYTRNESAYGPKINNQGWLWHLVSILCQEGHKPWQQFLCSLLLWEQLTRRLWKQQVNNHGWFKLATNRVNLLLI